jgi:hypothetical protein
MALFDNVQEVTIIISATRKEAIATGKVVSEQRNFTITSFYTEDQLKELVASLTPVT